VTSERTGRFLRWLLLCLAACASATPPLLHRTGAVDDFAYFAGGWSTKQHRRVDGTWEDFPGTLCAKPYMGTMITVDELVFPTKGWTGVTVRTFDLAAKQWSVYWISSKTGVMGTPVVGGFTGPVGELYGHEDGALIRYLWTKIDAERACKAMQDYLDAEVPVGEHLADQLLLPLALAGGGRFRSATLSLHSTTNIETIQHFLDVEIRVEDVRAGVVDVIVGPK
jgi:RNA 3'-terminal phosphate cyclase